VGLRKSSRTGNYSIVAMTIHQFFIFEVLCCKQTQGIERFLEYRLCVCIVVSRKVILEKQKRAGNNPDSYYEQ